MAEVIFVPRVKTSSKTIQSPISKCGDNWWRDIRIRSPYKKMDAAFRTLPSLGEPEQVEMFDPNFLVEIMADFDRISLFTSRHSGDLSDTQRSNVEMLMTRASAYLIDAKTIQDRWSTGFTTNHNGRISPWPLHDQPTGLINANVEEGHRRDSDKWKRLIRAALRNLRCAEEVAKKATIRQHNKMAYFHGRRYGANIPGLSTGQTQQLVPGLSTGKLKPETSIPGFTPNPPPPPPPPAEPAEPIIPIGEELEEGPEPIIPIGEELEEGELPLPKEPSGPEPSEAGPTEPKSELRISKKKNNTLLLAGAAVLGALALSKGKSR